MMIQVISNIVRIFFDFIVNKAEIIMILSKIMTILTDLYAGVAK